MEGPAPRFNAIESHEKGQRCSLEKSVIRRAGARRTIPGSWPCQSFGPSASSRRSMFIPLPLEDRRLIFLCQVNSKGEDRSV